MPSRLRLAVSPESSCASAATSFSGSRGGFCAGATDGITIKEQSITADTSSFFIENLHRKRRAGAVDSKLCRARNKTPLGVERMKIAQGFRHFLRTYRKSYCVCHVLPPSLDC